MPNERRVLRIELRRTPHHAHALAILDGRVPPVVNDMEVMRHLYFLAVERGIALHAVRADEDSDTEYSMDEIKVALQHNMQIVGGESD